jgi:hypothetical protein
MSILRKATLGLVLAASTVAGLGATAASAREYQPDSSYQANYNYGRDRYDQLDHGDRYWREHWRSEFERRHHDWREHNSRDRYVQRYWR